MSGIYETIVFDAKSAGTPGTAASNTFAHTVGSYNQRLLVVSTSQQQNGVQRTATGVTYDSVGMTKADSLQLAGDSEASLWYLVAPNIGTANVVVTYNGSCGIGAGAASFYNVEQISPLDGTAKDSNPTGTPTDSVTPSVDNALICDAMWTAQAGGTRSPLEAGQTVVWSTTVSVGDSGGGSYKIATTAGAEAMTWNASGQNGWIIVLGAFKAAKLTGGAALFFP